MEGKSNQTTCLNFPLHSIEQYGHFYGFHIFEGQYSKRIVMNLELRLLKMFMWGLAYWEDMECDWYMRFAIHTMEPKLSQLAKEFEADFECVKNQYQGVIFDAIIYDLLKAIRQFKGRVRSICIHFLKGAFKCVSTPFNLNKFGEYVRDTTSFIDLIQMNLRSLQNSNLICPRMKQTIALIQKELEEYRMPVDAPNRLFDFIPITRAWLNRISFLTYLCWFNGTDESWASDMETILNFLLQKAIPCTSPRVVSSHLEPTMIPQLLSRHLDFLLRDLVLPVKCEIDTVQEGLIFMLSFIMDPPDVNLKDKEMIWEHIYCTINTFPSLIYSIQSDEVEENFKPNFSNFLMKVNRAKAKVRGLFVVVPYSSQFTSPNTNATPSFLDVLVVNLRSMLEIEVDLIPCSKHLWKSLSMELESFRPFIKTIMELLQHDGDKEIKGLWGETMNMIYNVDYFTKLYFLRRFSTWYGIISLSYVIEHTKFIKLKIKEIDGMDKVHKKKKIGDYEQTKGTGAFISKGLEGNKNDSMGFKEVEETIINDLTRGRMSLTVISITGSGSQGKTNLAKKIYNEPNVRWRFQKVVWLDVSKDFHIKDLLIKILYDHDKGGGANESEIEYLTLDVWRSFKRKRYLIVLDDIWDIDAWGKLESLFPDDNNGSRILFTTRNHELGTQIELSSISHPLKLFNDEESWELIKMRVFDSKNCDKEFLGIGKKIATYCKGLPLALALIAGVLGRTKRNLNSWNKVAENLKTHLGEEGCGDVVRVELHIFAKSSETILPMF